LRGYNGAVLEDVGVVTTPAALPVPLDAAAPWTALFAAHITTHQPHLAVIVEVSVGVNGSEVKANTTITLETAGSHTVNARLSVL
jgi:hypothetical protein